MSTYELLEELAKKSQPEIEFCLAGLMLKNKIDFVQVSNAYTRALNMIKDDQLNQLIEAETCVMESFIYKIGGKKREDYIATQRCLHLLNNSKRFQMKSLNEKYAYDREVGKDASWYERNKNKI